MELPVKIWGPFRGISFVFLIMFSTYFGTIFLITPFLPLFFVSPRVGRTATVLLIWFWKVYCVAVYEVLFQTKVKVYGDVPSDKDATLMIMNHRTRLDWLYLFSFQVRHASLKHYTISLKNVLKSLPGIGWAMQIAGFIFLDRKWEEDEANISKCLRVFREVQFKQQRSDIYAEKNNLPKYNYVLHPRTTGFNHFVQEMKKDGLLDHLLDITIAYPRGIPQSELDIFKGNFPEEIHFHVKTFPNSQIPSQVDDLHNWCKDRWSKKEKVLQDFYEKKAFPKSEKELLTNNSLIGSLFLCSWISWTLTELIIVYLLWLYPILWLYVVACTMFYVYVTKYTKGFNILIADAFKV
ncbi:LCLT1-like protein [Mya arenaria]|uniref:LCLT1-like protein n=1 Tax=Mya arenaria TaxID=6604 RepID=A0ABY7FDK3_MYAAR|nr:LCLT1-like protein [Mya arenaria]